ncbi:MAG: hypothetical protein ABEH90_09875 [Halolamina sp.]
MTQERVATPEVSFSLSGEDLTLRDEAGGGEVLVELDGETSLTPASESWFDVPMDGAVSLETTSLAFPHNTAVWLRGAGGEAHGRLTERETSVAGGGTFIDVSAAMKVVVYVERGSVSGHIVERDETSGFAVTEFDGPTRVIIGVRSVHERPTATMTVPHDVEGLMEAVSHLGTSMKEWSAERSWPTLRGHSPAIELGDELRIPDRLAKPETGVTVAVPPEVGDVLRVAPLAHYFGADLVPADTAELRICGHAETLGRGRELERSVDELLARALVLDSLVRIGGYYSLPRYEYEELAPTLPFYPPELDDQPVDRQLLEYLEIPFEELAPYVPRWSGTATLRPSVSEATALPYLLNSLARIHVTADAQPRPDPETFAQFSTATNVPTGVASLGEDGRRAAMAYERSSPERSSVLVIGDEAPGQSCFRRTNWQYHEVDGGVPTPDHRESVTKAELDAALAANPLYVHYGNRVTEEGYVCSDGVLSFKDVPPAAVGAVSFAWHQAETASVAGLLDTTTVACLTDTPMEPRVAEAFGKYLVLGYPPVQAARAVGLGDAFRFVGDAALSLVDHADGTLPVVFHVERADDGSFRASFCCRVSRRDGLGSLLNLDLEENSSSHYLSGRFSPMAAPLSVADLVDIAEGDHLLRFTGAVPDAVPQESVLHASREDWPHGRVVEPKRAQDDPIFRS